MDRGNNTVLFCSGGPGQIVRPASLETTYADFLVDNGYNVVHFHLRGCGFSQIPLPVALMNIYGHGLLSKISKPSAEIFSEKMERGTRLSEEVTEQSWRNSMRIFTQKESEN